MREACKRLVEHRYFQAIVIAIILLNGVIIVAETYEPGSSVLITLDKMILLIFVLEIVVKVIGLGFRRYFSSGWNWFDFIIVAASLAFLAAPFVSALRLVRVLRLFRMIPAIPSLRKIIDSLMRSIPALTGVLGLTLLLFSIYAIIGTTFFKDVLPYEFFGSFHTSLFTLMQVVTFESWASQVARPIIEEMPWAWIYFVTFIIVGALVILNLVVAVILSYLGQEDDADRDERLDRLLQENTELKKDVQEIKQLLLEQRRD
ncbi:ion transporter [Paenibacillus lemnae]|uniref:Ion transporter n=1 Tax=Paenibacillus lemnae TaxID=1330551 RepID=A0A848M243_PAELE|nr:ion transporter [Paenibacillus lemnae]NMO94310.1 ion transporter [Paenibacillus lemnae]